MVYGNCNAKSNAARLGRLRQLRRQAIAFRPDRTPEVNFQGMLCHPMEALIGKMTIVSIGAIGTIPNAF